VVSDSLTVLLCVFRSPHPLAVSILSAPTCARLEVVRVEAWRLAGKDVLDSTNTSIFYVVECSSKNIFFFCMRSSVQETECGRDTDADMGTSSAALTVCTGWGKTSLVQLGFGTG